MEQFLANASRVTNHVMTFIKDRLVMMKVFFVAFLEEHSDFPEKLEAKDCPGPLVMKKRKPIDREFRAVTKRIRTIVNPIANKLSGHSISYNDSIKNGRSLKWYNKQLALKLRASKKFSRLVAELQAEGYTLDVKTTKGYSNSSGATRVHVKRIVS